MRSKRSLEGYLLIDHRSSPGIGPSGSIRGPGSMLEAPIATCSHCQRGIIMNPLRTRDRAYCPKCDHYLCDECEAARVASGGACRTFRQIIEDVQNRAITALQRSR